MLIPKGVEVVCFDTLLQVLILKAFRASGVPQLSLRVKRIFEGEAHPSRVFAYEWQGKGLRDRECVRVANTGLRRARFCAFDARRKVNGGRRLKVESRGPMPE